MKRFASFILFFLFVSLQTFGQSRNGYATTSKKAIKLFEQATVLLKSREFPEAEKKLQSALAKDPNFIEAHLRLASIYGLYRKKELEKQSLEQVARIANGNLKYKSVYMKLAKVYFNEGDYDRALKMGNLFLRSRPRESEAKATEWIMENATYAKELMAKPVPFKAVMMDSTVNSFALQYFPVVTVDENTLIYTKRDGSGGSDTEDIVVSHRNKDGNWSKPVSISDNINTLQNEGTCTISSDGKMMIFTSCTQGGERKNYGSCDLYVTYKEGDDWSEPKNLGRTVNTSAWESQPALSADGRTLFFVSDRRGGFGRRDIYYTTKTDNGLWTPATNLGKNINTSGDEIGPFIHVNNQRLYFSSNGHKGMGGFDFFYSDRLPGGEFGPAENLGYPINDHNDQSSLTVNADGSLGYISIDQYQGNTAHSSLYTFEIPKAQRVLNRSSYVAGTVLDKDTQKPVAAKVELYNVSNEQLVNAVTADAVNGSYSIVLTEGSRYALFVSAPGYLFRSIPFNFEKTAGELESVKMDILLEPIRKGQITRLDNVFFDTNSYELREESKTELNKAVKFLEANRKLVMEISGHTDDVGDATYNKTLSKNRAKSVYEYLVGQGIAKSRLKYVGYGKEQPFVPNTSDANRQKNRRIEFKIIGDNQP
ncbi:OmpA family protein [Persicobacter psychrovividus]